MDENVYWYRNQLADNISNNLIKGKGFSVGTIRVWNGGKYKKKGSGDWEYVGEYEGTNPDTDASPKEKLDKVEKAIADKSVEYLYGISNEGKILVGQKGDKSSVLLNDKQEKKLNNAIVTHNHPLNSKKFAHTSSFSKNDVFNACSLNVKEFRAVGEDGYKYSLSNKGYKDWGTQVGAIKLEYAYDNIKDEVLTEYQNMFKKLRKKYSKDTKEYQEKKKEASANLTHEVMKRLSKEFNLEYKQIKPKGS